MVDRAIDVVETSADKICIITNRLHDMTSQPNSKSTAVDESDHHKGGRIDGLEDE
jgi:hypothetical protein